MIIDGVEFPIAEQFFESLLHKWGHLIPAHTNEYKRKVAAVLVENQNRYIERAQAETQYQGLASPLEAIRQLETTMGADWKNKMLRALAKQSMGCVMHELFSVQPLTEPVGLIAYFADRLPPSENPTIRSEAVAAKTRKSKVWFSSEAAVAIREYGVDAGEELFDSVFEEMFLEQTRECIGQLIDTAEHERCVIEVKRDSLSEDGVFGTRVFERGKADRFVCFPELSEVIVKHFGPILGWPDPLFPKNKILLFQKGDDLVDATAVWCPYAFYATPIVAGGTLGLTSRSAFKVVAPSRLRLIEIVD